MGIPRTQDIAKRSNKFAELLSRVEAAEPVSTSKMARLASFSKTLDAKSATTEPRNDKYQKRVQKILSRLNDLNIGLEQDRSSKLVNFDKSLATVDAKLTNFQESDLIRFNTYKLKITEFLNYIENDKSQQETEKKKQLDELERLERVAEERFAAEKKALKDTETRLLAQVEEKFFAVRKQLGVESRARYESIEQVKGSLEIDLPRLQELI